jgi:hypothetical protein
VSRARRALPRSIAASGLALALACATSRVPAPSPLRASDPRPAALLESITRDAATRRSLRGVARLAVDAPAGSGRATQIIVLERPAYLRVEVLGLLDQTLALLVTDGARYRLVRSQDRSVAGGPVYDAMLRDVAGLSVTPEQAVGVLLGAPFAADARLERAALLPENAMRLELRRDGAPLREQLDCDAAGNLQRWALLGADGDMMLEALYGDRRPLGSVAFAYEVELRDPRADASVRVVWSRVELNPVLPPELFAVPPEAAP